MATSTSSSRMPRLGIFASKAGSSKPGPSSSPSREADEEDDWYIPYNGPYEQPQHRTQEQSRDSWGELLNGWLSDDDARKQPRKIARDARSSQAASAPPEATGSRVHSGVSRKTQSTGGRGTHERNSQRPRMPPISLVRPERGGGGVGESPVPVERALPPLPDHPASTPQPQRRRAVSKRGSLASIFTFGRKSLRLSVSMDNLGHPFKRERANTDSAPTPPNLSRASSRGRPRAHTTAAPPERVSEADEYYDSYYSTLLNTPGNEHWREQDGSTSRPHPYAYPFSETREPRSAPATLDKGKGRLLNAPKISFNLLNPQNTRSDVPEFLKPSPRNSLLKASISTPNLRNVPRGKQRWWSPETWCDAIILPRPRFALSFVDPSGSGRIVSPPPTPVMFPDETSPISQERASSSETKSLKKVRSTANLMAPAQSQAGEKPQEEPLIAGTSTLKAPRPKSFALDDLALPSPVPSLTKVLEEGRQLEERRKQWQTQASRSFLDKRAGAISRARSKSIGAAQSRVRGRSREPESTFEFLAERTLLGNQIRPPTIHVRGPSTSKSQEQSQQTQTQTQTATQGIQSTVSNIFSRTGSRAHSHVHSNSLGNSASWKSATNESGGGHSRSQSVGKQALKLVVTTAAGAAVFCGLSSPASDGAITPGQEKNLTVQSPQSLPTRLPEQIHTVENGEGGTVIVISSTSPSAALAMLSNNGVNGGVSPTPSALSGSAEGIGIAITLPSDDHSRQQGREPIRFPAHPYAQGFGYQPTAVSIQTQNANREARPLDTSGTQQDVNRHRQPVLVHPYSQPGHPYASTSHTHRDPQHPMQHTTIPTNANSAAADTKLYAETSPGYIQIISPEDIRYSPDVPLPVVVTHSQLPNSESSHSATTARHPYVAASKRTSELGFGEALIHTMRRASVDSGLGTSESGGFARGIDWERPTIDLSPDPAAVDDVIHLYQTPESRWEPFASSSRPEFQRQGSSATAANETTASSPPEAFLPPAFRRTASGLSAGRMSSKSALNNSSGSSPGMVSQASSPPLSPRPINTNESLERFHDLFYRPTRSSSSISEDAGIPTMRSGRLSGHNIPVDVSSQSGRSAITRSGLSDLARQLSEDLEELRRERGSEVSEVDSLMWGRRYGGLRGHRPDDMEDPNVVLAHLASSSGSPGTYHSPLRLPIDTTFVNPRTNIPEDVESSRGSSILELTSNPDDANELVRMGEVGVTATPPVVSSPHRFSTQLSLVGHGDEQPHEPAQDEYLRPPRAISQQSALLSPISPLTHDTRSSYMTYNTDASRMSGLSDFPAPPSQIPPPSISSGPTLTVPRLIREYSYDTFGRQTTDDECSVIGQAL